MQISLSFVRIIWTLPQQRVSKGGRVLKSISFTVRDVHAHWKHQLQLAVQAGRVIIVLLPEIDERFAYTGKQEFSGTGRKS